MIMDLSVEQRRALHRCMIDFVIQKRNILDTTFLKTWVIFRRIFTQFPYTPRQLQLEFHLRFLPNLSEYVDDINEYHVDYFEKISEMNEEQRKKYFDECVTGIREISLKGKQQNYPMIEDGAAVEEAQDHRTTEFSVERSNDFRGYDDDFMRDAQMFFQRFPIYNRSQEMNNFLGFMQPCWEINTLLKSYPQQNVADFLWWRTRILDRQPQVTRKRKAPSGKTAVPAKKKK